MINKLIIMALATGLLFSIPCASQNVYHEIGLSAGLVKFQGDWGDSKEAFSNTDNVGAGISLTHFINFSFSRNFSYFNEHIKVRNQVAIHYASLTHFGQYVEDESAPFLLQNMFGETFVMEIGTGLEWYMFSLRDFENNYGALNPFAGIGINLVYFDPLVDTRLPGRIGSVTNTWPTFLPETSASNSRISNTPETTFGLQFQGGTHYRINRDFDLFTEIRWHYFFSDLVDGLNPNNPNNTSNDWMISFQVGAVYYLDR